MYVIKAYMSINTFRSLKIAADEHPGPNAVVLGNWSLRNQLMDIRTLGVSRLQMRQDICLHKCCMQSLVRNMCVDFCCRDACVTKKALHHSDIDTAFN